MKRFSDSVLSYGSAHPLPRSVIWEAGPLSLMYQAGELRQVRAHGVEIIQHLYGAVRDRHWNTVRPLLVKETLEIDGERFRVSFELEHRQKEIHFIWQGLIEADAVGSLSFTMEGVAKNSFLKNRVGLCILHPAAECSGKWCRVERGSGVSGRAQFPDRIEPLQPIPGFEDLRQLSYRASSGVEVELGFGGDWFEMEDQRNWSDDSFKTFSTPLHLPFPVTLEAGATVVQSVRLRVKTTESNRARPRWKRSGRGTGSSRPLTLEEGTLATPIPPLGLALASHREPLELAQLELLKALRLSHLRTTWDLSSESWREDFQLAAEQSEDLNLPLEVGLILPASPRPALSKLATELGRSRPDIARWLVFPSGGWLSEEEGFHAVRRHLHQFSRGATIGGGTRGDFVHLNQKRPPLEEAEFLSFAINPQVHTFDNASLLQNLQSIAAPVKAARELWGQLPLRVSSLTLKPPTSSPRTESPSTLPVEVDPRQMSLFGAAWTLGALSRLSASFLASLTLFETTGWLGVMERSTGSLLPAQFQSLPGGVFPLYHVLADCADFRGGQQLSVRASQPSDLQWMRLQSGRSNSWLVANPTPVAQPVWLRRMVGRVQVRRLEIGSALLSMQHPTHFRKREVEVVKGLRGILKLDLAPFSLVRISW